MTYSLQKEILRDSLPVSANSKVRTLMELWSKRLRLEILHKGIRIFLTLLYEQCFRSALLCVNPKWTICLLVAAIFGGEGDNLIAFKSRVSTNLPRLILSMDERNNGKCQNETSEYIAQLLYKHKYDLFFRYISQNFLCKIWTLLFIFHFVPQTSPKILLS